jgi:hypothetical protein
LFPSENSLLPSSQTIHRPTTIERDPDIDTNYVDGQDNDIPYELYGNKNVDDFYGGVTTEMLEMEVTTLLPTTTTVETTTIPISEFILWLLIQIHISFLPLPQGIVSFRDPTQPNSTLPKEKVVG